MAATEPIRDKKQLHAMATYFLQRGQLRNYVLLSLGVHTALRISDLLKLRWEDVYDEKTETFRTHITLTEHKTGKEKTIALNKQAIRALRLYLPYRRSAYVFTSRKGNRPISRVQAWRIIHGAAEAIGLSGKIGCHMDWKDTEKHLYIPPSRTAIIDASCAAETLHYIVRDKRLRRAFSKAMRDCFRWPGDCVTLHRDGLHSFCFTTRSGFPKYGGLILHEGERNGRTCLYYSVHT